jgi:hypothetical protein
MESTNRQPAFAGRLDQRRRYKAAGDRQRSAQSDEADAWATVVVPVKPVSAGGFLGGRLMGGSHDHLAFGVF